MQRRREVHELTNLVHPNVRMDGSGMEGDLHLRLLVGRQEARGRESSKVRAQGGHIQGILGAHITVVLHLEALLCLHHVQAAQPH